MERSRSLVSAAASAKRRPQRLIDWLSAPQIAISSLESPPCKTAVCGSAAVVCETHRGSRVD